MIDFGLVLSRFLHYAASTTLAGAAFFPLYAYAATEPERLVRWRGRVLLCSAILALVGCVGWFAFSVAQMSGGLADVIDPEVVGAVVHHTGFGVVWMTRMAVAAGLVAITVMLPSRSSMGRNLLIAVLAAGLLASLAGAAHLLAAGAWLGGLLPLGVILLGSRATRMDAVTIDVESVLTRFSGMGYAAVATLIGTGLINSWFLVGSVSNLFESTYGWILMVKLACFAGMLGLATANRFWLMPALEAAGRVGTTDAWKKQLRIHVLGEQGLGLLVLLCVSIIGTIRPAIGQ
jgi:copper resistance protein D